MIFKENKFMPLSSRGGRYVYTNEARNYDKSPYQNHGFRKALLFLHYNYF